MSAGSSVSAVTDERRAEAVGHRRHLVRRHVHDGRERKQELAIGERMRRRRAVDDRRQQIRAAVAFDETRARRDGAPLTSSAPGSRRPASICSLIRAATRRSTNGAISASGSSAARGTIAASRAASASAISRPCDGVQTPEAFTHERPPFSATDLAIRSSDSAQSRRAVRRRTRPCCSRGRAARCADRPRTRRPRRRRRRTCCARTGARSRPRRRDRWGSS